MRIRTQGYLLALMCVFLWSLIPVVAKLGQIDLDHHQFLFYSSLISFLVLLLYGIFTSRISDLFSFSLGEFLWTCVLGLLGTYIYYLLLYYGYREARGLDVLVMQYTWPLFVALLSSLLLGERPGVLRILGLMLGFFGVVVVLSRGKIGAIHLSSIHILLLVIFASLCFALFSVLSKSLKRDPVVLNIIYFFSATVASWISMCLFSRPLLPPLPSLLPLVLNGTLVNGFSYVLWIMALRRLDASSAAALVFLTPLIASLNLVFFFGEPFLPIYALGLGCILCGSYLAR